MSRLLKTWRRKRLTTYLAEENMLALQRLSEQSGVPMGRILDQALDEFFKKIELRSQDAKVVPPIAEDHFKDAAQASKTPTITKEEHIE